MFAIFTLPWQLGDLVPVPHNQVRHPGQGSWAGVEGGGVHSHCNCNKLNKTNELSAEMSRKLKNSRISISSIDPSISSRDPCGCFKYQHGLMSICCHR